MNVASHLTQSIPAADQSAIIALAQAGDQRAIDRVILSHHRFVISIARRYRNHGIDLDDLIQYGVIGLHAALPKFRPEKGNKFITYAAWWIRQSITTAIGDHETLVRIPRRLRERRRGKTEAQHEEHAEVIRQGRATTSIDTISDAGMEIHDPDADSSAQSQDSQQKRLIDTLITGLDLIDQYIIRARFGLQDGRRMALHEVAQDLGLSRERIRQREARAMRTLTGLVNRKMISNNNSGRDKTLKGIL